MCSKASMLAIKWALKKGFPVSSKACCYAVGDANDDYDFKTLKFLRSLTPPCPWDEGVTETAKESKNYKLLVWAIQHGCPYEANDIPSEILTTIKKKKVAPLVDVEAHCLSSEISSYFSDAFLPLVSQEIVITL